MKVMLLSCMTLLFMSATNWETDFATAKRKSRESGRVLLLNFSGSDWCIPCIRMHKEVFESEGFGRMSDSLLVLYRADFPRKKSNALPGNLRRQNDSLAAIYNPQGKFPLTILLSPDGKVLRQWEGYPEGGVSLFIDEIKKIANDSNH